MGHHLGRRPSHRTTRVGLVAAGALTAVLALPGLAQAHVEVQPDTAEGGDFTAVAFRVPNERDDASTTRVQVSLPADQPLGSVQTRPMPGWRVTTRHRHLDTPIEFFGSKVDSVVSQVTWTATDGGLRPGTFDDFTLSLGQLPKTGTLTFNAVQTYSSGEVVQWNQVSADPSTEPEHPAPTLELTAPAAEGAAETPGDSTAHSTAGSSPAPAATARDSSGTWGIGLGGAALLVSLVTAGLTWRRRSEVLAAEIHQPDQSRTPAGV